MLPLTLTPESTDSEPVPHDARESAGAVDVKILIQELVEFRVESSLVRPVDRDPDGAFPLRSMCTGSSFAVTSGRRFPRCRARVPSLHRGRAEPGGGALEPGCRLRQTREIPGCDRPV